MTEGQPDGRGPPLPRKFLRDLLTAAIKDGNFHMAEVLVDHGAEPSFRALCIAAEKGETQLVWSMLYEGADPTALESMPLRLAARNGHLETVKTLIKHGADASAACNEAVKEAAAADHHEVVMALLNAGAQLTHPVPSPTGGERGPNHEGLSRKMSDVLRAFGDKGWDPRSNSPALPVRRP
jgi:hypothetical protein